MKEKGGIVVTETKVLIKAAFLKLYSKTAYNEITIKKLCESIPVARTTFYTYYRNISELKDEIETETIEEIRRVSDGIYKTFGGDYFYNTMDFINAHNDVFEAFLVIQPNYDFILAFKLAIIEHLKENYKSNYTNKNYDLELEMIASGIIGYYTFWLKNPEKVDLSDLQKKLKKLILVLETFI